MARTRIAVVGLGQFGTSLVRQLCRFDVEVLAIDKDPQKIEEIADELYTMEKNTIDERTDSSTLFVASVGEPL